MKELSIEEKAKCYDKALERAKEIIDCSKSDTKEVRMVLSFFPELKESKDKTICKNLIAFLKQCKAVYGDGFKQFDLDIDDALAWLEKKGEKCKKGNIDKTIKFKENTDKNDELTAKLKELADTQHLLTKERAMETYPFVEQKPANSIWHEMTENPEGDTNDRTLVVFEDGYSTTSNALLHIGFGTSKLYKWAYVNDILRLTSNTKRGEQKSAEWSEEDETIAKALTKATNDNVLYGYIGKSKLLEWLKSLKDRVQPQSQWKPSEEHLHTLEAVISDYTEQGLSYTKDSLNGLYEQLKKLKD